MFHNATPDIKPLTLTILPAIPLRTHIGELGDRHVNTLNNIQDFHEGNMLAQSGCAPSVIAQHNHGRLVPVTTTSGSIPNFNHVSIKPTIVPQRKIPSDNIQNKEHQSTLINRISGLPAPAYIIKKQSCVPTVHQMTPEEKAEHKRKSNLERQRKYKARVGGFTDLAKLSSIDDRIRELLHLTYPEIFTQNMENSEQLDLLIIYFIQKALSLAHIQQ